MIHNVSFALLDDPVVTGRADEPVVDAWTHARLLEESAALAGVLRHLGVAPGVPVVVCPDDDVDAVVAALATARIGGAVTTEDDPAAAVVVGTAGSAPPAAGRHRLLRGEPDGDGSDLDWEVLLRAGRTDPAGAERLAPEAAYSPERSVADQIEVLAGTRPPYAAAELRRLLQVERP